VGVLASGLVAAQLAQPFDDELHSLVASPQSLQLAFALG